MILKKLEIQGFESFAERTEVSFEQNVRNIRGEKAQDVTFNGTDKRRAVGMAEVSLTVDNTSAPVPHRFRRAATRRAYRRELVLHQQDRLTP